MATLHQQKNLAVKEGLLTAGTDLIVSQASSERPQEQVTQSLQQLTKDVLLFAMFHPIFNSLVHC